MIYFVATPIGNLKDITLRALETLEKSDVICCEDTRTSKPLLDHYDIKKKLVSFHKFNEEARIAEIISWAEEGKEISIISDAGMPGISDPGNRLVQACIEKNIPYTVLPGPTAFSTALVLSGFENTSFKFYGFLPVKGKDRKNILEAISLEPSTQILYEAPHKLEKTLEDLAAYCPDRKVAVIREISKLYEDVKIFKASEYKDQDLVYRGEIVIVIDADEIKAKDFSDDEIKAFLEEAKAEGLKNKDAVKAVSEKYGIKKNRVYDIAVKNI